MKKDSLRLVSVVGFVMTVVVPVGTLLGKDATAIAQTDSCYMVTSSGRVVSLSKLCNNGQTTPGKANSPTPGAGNAPANMFQARIKYRLGKTPVIHVTFNVRQTFEMIVDTGADGTLITREMARALQLPVTGIGQFSMADGRVVALPLSRVQSISVSGAY